VQRPTARHAAAQVGEFAVGAVVAYAAIGAVWLLTGAAWAPAVMALVLVVAAVVIELRYGAKATGLVVGVLPVALLTAGLLTTFSLVIARLH
jgi:hypothetical protein